MAEDLRFRTLARRPAVRRRATRVALVVGAILTAINQSDRLIAGDVTVELGLQILLTFVVPYCVSTWSACLAIRETSER